MRYLIDGHNLIPRIPGLALEMIDDEQRLVEKLQDFCRAGQHQVEVYFDGAPPGHAGRRKYGAVTAVFVRQGQIADDAMRARLQKLGAQARNWAVVSSDRAVRAAGRELHAAVLSSEEFASGMAAREKPSAEGEKPPEVPLSQDELEDWMQFFRRKKQN